MKPRKWLLFLASAMPLTNGTPHWHLLLFFCSIFCRQCEDIRVNHFIMIIMIVLKGPIWNCLQSPQSAVNWFQHTQVTWVQSCANHSATHRALIKCSMTCTTWHEGTAQLPSLTEFKSHLGGRNSSLVVFGLAVHSVAGSILLWGNFPVEGIFPLELTWVQTPFPPKTLSDESTNRGLVCAHMHFIARTQKILTFMS